MKGFPSVTSRGEGSEKHRLGNTVWNPSVVQGCENGVFGKRCFCPLPKTRGFDTKDGENDDLHCTRENKGLRSSEPGNRRK